MKAYLILLFSFCLLVACKKVLKDPMDYYPKVQTVSASVLPDGAVQVKGFISSKGSSEIEYAGFCMDTTDLPKMKDNQRLAVFSDKFSVVYPASYFNAGKKFYFRSWAVNGLGFAYGNTVSLENIKASPVEVPCSLSLNTIRLGASFQPGNYYTVSKPTSSSFGEWSVRAETSDLIVKYDFGSALTTKVFKTTSSEPNAGEVYISFQLGYSWYTVGGGADVYVNEIQEDKWEIAICRAPWDFVGSTYFLDTRFTVPK